MQSQILFFSFICCFFSPLAAREATSVQQKKAKTEYLVRYRIKLDKVNCDKHVGYQRSIKADTFTDMEGHPYVRYRYSDDFINITWSTSVDAFNYTLINKTDRVITLQTNLVYGRDWDGHPSRFGYSLERPYTNETMEIPAYTFQSGFFIPFDNYPTRTRKEIQPILPSSFNLRLSALLTSKKYVGKQMRILLPVFIGGVQFNYIFTFVVEKVDSIKKQAVSLLDTPALDTSLARLPEKALASDSLYSLPKLLEAENISALLLDSGDDSLEKEKDEVTNLRYLASFYNTLSITQPMSPTMGAFPILPVAFSTLSYSPPQESLWDSRN